MDRAQRRRDLAERPRASGLRLADSWHDRVGVGLSHPPALTAAQAFDGRVAEDLRFTTGNRRAPMQSRASRIRKIGCYSRLHECLDRPALV